MHPSPAGVGRSPNPSNANNVRNCTPAGSLNNNNANNTNGVVADREKARFQVDQQWLKAEHSHRGLGSFSGKPG